MQIKVKDIEWFTDGKKVKLPKKMTVEITNTELRQCEDEEARGLLITNKLSAETGYSVDACGYTIPARPRWLDHPNWLNQRIATRHQLSSPVAF